MNKMEDQKNQNQPIPFKKSRSWKTILGKKWAFPAIYIGTAAIILAFVMWYQGSVTDSVMDKNDLTNGISVTTPTDASSNPASDVDAKDATPVNATQPLAWPVAKGVTYDLGMGFFDDQQPKEKQEAALVKYEDRFIPHTGIDLVSTDGKSFDVTAALAGKVVKVENDPLVGNQVEIEHADKMVTVYQSLEKVVVKPGDEVTQGQVLGTAGRNVFEKDAGVHLHFEVRVDGNPVNPEQYLTQSEAKSQ
jgi:stage II sporulation protein Q